MEGRGKYSYRIKMQEVWKARKDAHTGKKAHFSTGQAERREIKETKTEGKRRKKARMQKKTTEGKIIRRHGDAPMVAGCSPKMTGFFNSSPFKTAGRKKRNGRNGFLEIHCLTNQLYPKKHQAKNRNQHLTYALAFQSKHQGE